MNLDEIKSIVADILNISPSEVEPDSRFIEDLGADSLDVFQIITEIEDQFGIQIPDDAIENIVTVGDAATQIQNALAK